MRTSPPEGGPERLVALADGVFAIAITLLVLDLSVPQRLDPAEFREALGDLLPNLGAYALSLLVLGDFWQDHRRIFRTVRQVDAQVIALNVIGLGLAALLPFPTTLVAEYADESVSAAAYGAVVAALGATHLVLLVVLSRRPWLRVAPGPDPTFARHAAELGTTVAVFALSVPLALVFGPAAMWAWLVMIPAKIVLGRLGGSEPPAGA